MVDYILSKSIGASVPDEFSKKYKSDLNAILVSLKEAIMIIHTLPLVFCIT